MKYLKYFENVKINNLKIYMSGDLKKDFFLAVTDNDIVKGGLYCGKPNIS